MRESKLTLFIFLAPTLIFVLVFIAYPIIYSAYLGLSEYNYASDPSPKFIGFKGFMNTIFKDSMFHTAFINQFQFAIPYFMITFLGSLILAILIDELRYGASFFQVLFYLPMIIPLSLVGVTFAWLLFPDVGIFNHILRRLGVKNWNIDWYGDPKTALNSLVLARSWKMLGFTLIIFLSGLQGIPKSIREAAKVDGASFFQEIWYIVLPNLKPYLYISSIWILINAMKTFDLVAVITQGGPGMSTLTLYYYSWKLAFQRLDMGRASQVAYITAAVIILFSLGFSRLFKSETASRM